MSLSNCGTIKGNYIQPDFVWQSDKINSSSSSHMQKHFHKDQLSA